MQIVKRFHQTYIFDRRVNAILDGIVQVLGENTPAQLLDFGTGDGQLSQQLLALYPDMQIVGIDVHQRPTHAVPTAIFDGYHLPFADKQFDAVFLVDVLHHTDDFKAILREIARVGKTIIVKDHFKENMVDDAILRTLDWVGNAPHGVRLPYNYFSRAEWQAALAEINGIEAERLETVSDMYPQPFQMILGKRIQFISKIILQ